MEIDVLLLRIRVLWRQSTAGHESCHHSVVQYHQKITRRESWVSTRSRMNWVQLDAFINLHPLDRWIRDIGFLLLFIRLHQENEGFMCVRVCKTRSTSAVNDVARLTSYYFQKSSAFSPKRFLRHCPSDLYCYGLGENLSWMRSLDPLSISHYLSCCPSF